MHRMIVENGRTGSGYVLQLTAARQGQAREAVLAPMYMIKLYISTFNNYII